LSAMVLETLGGRGAPTRGSAEPSRPGSCKATLIQINTRKGQIGAELPSSGGGEASLCFQGLHQRCERCCELDDTFPL